MTIGKPGTMPLQKEIKKSYILRRKKWPTGGEVGKGENLPGEGMDIRPCEKQEEEMDPNLKKKLEGKKVRVWRKNSGKNGALALDARKYRVPR